MAEGSSGLAYRGRPVFAAACLGMLLFGVTMTTLGAVLPVLMDRYELGDAGAGSLLGLMPLFILLSSLVFGPIVDRFGYRPVLIAGAVGVMAGLEGLAFAPSWGAAAAAVFVFGLGGGLLNGGTNALVSDISERGRSSGLSLLGVFFGLGAFGVPFVLGALQRWAGEAAILAGIGAAVMAPLAFFLAIRFPPPKQPRGFPIGKASRLLREAPLLLFGGMLFFQSGMEFTIGGWSRVYFERVLRVGEGRSVLVLSLFWVGMMTARFAMMALLRRISAAAVLGIYLGIAVVGSALLLAPGGLAPAVLGLFLVGFGLSAGYPVVLGYIGDLYRELTGTAFSIAIVMGLVGGGLLSYLTGLLGDRYGLRASLLIVPLSALAQAALFALASRHLAPRGVPAAAHRED